MNIAFELPVTPEPDLRLVLKSVVRAWAEARTAQARAENGLSVVGGQLEALIASVKTDPAQASRLVIEDPIYDESVLGAFLGRDPFGEDGGGASHTDDEDAGHLETAEVDGNDVSSGEEMSDWAPMQGNRVPAPFRRSALSLFEAFGVRDPEAFERSFSCIHLGVDVDGGSECEYRGTSSSAGISIELRVRMRLMDGESCETATMAVRLGRAVADAPSEAA